MSKGLGNFVWYDLMTTDIDASEAFYTQLFGWTIKKMDTGEGEAYRGWMNGENGFGGVETRKQPGAPSAWVGYIEVEDVDATVARSDKMGATTLLAPMDIPGGVGRIAFLDDPQGATFALYRSGATHSDWAPRKDQAGDFEWAELGTTDVNGAKAFYGENFNWSSGRTMEMGDGAYHMIMLGEQPVCGMFDKPAEQPVSAWTHYVRVDDIDASVDRARSLGANILHGPITIPGMVSFAVVADPTGAVFGMAKSLSEK